MNSNSYAKRPGIVTKLQLDEGTYTVEYREDRRVVEVEYGVKEEAISEPEFNKAAIFQKGTKVEVDPFEAAKIIQGASSLLLSPHFSNQLSFQYEMTI